ncbi:MAG: hypothetical protein MK291_09720, partial [Planctomycetes bacterium]|nr:hypothetical protein [Planctomycetota bacterium]
ELRSFLRRRKLLFEARRLLLQGAPDEAFDRLREPTLSLSSEADALRERVVGILCREAARLADEGDVGLANRYLDRVASADPLLARRWRARVMAAESAVVERERRGRITEALSGVLRDMRREGHADEAGSARGFRLILDDLGEFLVPLREEFSLGHARAGRADFGVMADLEALHVRFCVRESFHGGHRWCVAPVERAALRVRGETVSEDGVVLEPGLLLELSPSVRVEVEGLGEGASSIALRLKGGVECEGATRLLLMGRGAAGELTLGREVSASLRVAGLEEELSLRLTEELQLCLRSRAPLRVGGGASGEAAADGALSLPVPPASHVDVLVGASRDGRPPYGVMLAPLTSTRGAEGADRS